MKILALKQFLTPLLSARDNVQRPTPRQIRALRRLERQVAAARREVSEPRPTLQWSLYSDLK
ncbi:MAG TPA: hypothetical protein VGN77_07635 [Steroidobacteraceae bacterium]|nr:hypothetical protein [Steroidobacteraceae bacterium]